MEKLWSSFCTSLVYAHDMLRIENGTNLAKLSRVTNRSRNATARLLSIVKHFINQLCELKAFAPSSRNIHDIHITFPRKAFNRLPCISVECFNAFISILFLFGFLLLCFLFFCFIYMGKCALDVCFFFNVCSCCL